LVLSFIDCPTCGNVSKDISTGEEISQKGRRTTLQVKNLNDMVRELIKSNTCTVIVPELDLELTPGTLGIQFSTVQALFNAVWEDLSRNVMQIQNASDGSNPLADFIKRLEECVYCEREFTFIIDDPLSNSYIQRYENETQIHVELYDRTEQVADR
jgi:zinc finger protein